MSEERIQEYQQEVVAVAVRQMDAFRIGFRDGKRFSDWGFNRIEMSYADAVALRPKTAGAFPDAYINGFGDGFLGDYWRLDRLPR